MTAMARILKFNIVQATANHTATLIFLHGSGDSSENVKEWIKIMNRDELKFPHIKIIYPNAPHQPYTPNGGQSSNVWFDRLAISKSVPEHESSIDSICKEISGIFDKEIAAGIPYSRIVIAGFSMGGALSFHVAYRFNRSLAGCCVMSGFLNDNSLVYEALKTNGAENTPPLLQFHGLRDGLVPPSWGEDTFKNVTGLGVKGEFISLKNADHELNRLEIHKFKDWLNHVLPEKF